jgi:hypothetical protein
MESGSFKTPKVVYGSLTVKISQAKFFLTTIQGQLMT